MKFRPRAAAVAAALAVVPLTLALSACGSDATDSADAATSAATTGATAAIAAYDGPEASLPTTFPEPTKKEGFTFTIGSPVPSAAVPALKAQADAAKAETERLGGRWIQTDANFSVQKQVTDFQQLLSQKVDAIILSALDPNSLTPLLAKAKAQGVLVFINDVPFKAGLAPVDGFTASSLSGTDQGAYGRAKYVAQTTPGAKFGLIGVGIPAPMLDYMVSQVKVWGQKFGLQYVDRVDATGDGPEPGAQAANALLAKHKDLDVIFAVTDSTALGAATAVKSSGRSEVKVIGNGGYAQGVEGVKAGDLTATWWTNSGELHKQLVWAAYNALTKQNLPQPTQIVLGDGTLVTTDNADAVTPVG